MLSASYWFLAWLTLQPWRARQHIPPKVSWFSGDYASQKITFFNIKDIIFLPFEPTYLAHSPNIPPTVTIHCATGQPVSTKTFGIGASESCVC
jgi:hypothetical protein